MNKTATPESVPGLQRSVRALDPERAAFERWLADVHLLTATWNEQRNCYDEFPAHLAFCAWKSARPPRDKVGVVYNVAAALAQRKPLQAFGEFDNSTHIGHRQFGRAYAKADEDTRLLAVKLADAVRAL